MKRKTKILLAVLSPFVVLVLFVATFITLLYFGFWYDVAPGVTGDKIKQIELGITKEELFEILGEPLEIEADNFSYPRLIYAKYDYLLWGTNFYISLDSNNCVNSLYAKDEGSTVYWKDENNDYINEIDFKKYFK